MNRQQRRAEAAKARATMRHEAVRDALAYMAARNDPSITGATLVLPDGEILHVSAETSRRREDGEAVH